MGSVLCWNQSFLVFKKQNFWPKFSLLSAFSKVCWILLVSLINIFIELNKTVGKVRVFLTPYPSHCFHKMKFTIAIQKPNPKISLPKWFKKGSSSYSISNLVKKKQSEVTAFKIFLIKSVTSSNWNLFCYQELSPCGVAHFNLFHIEIDGN